MMNVMIVGVGALGSHVVMCARNWDCKVAAVDHDRVSSKNVMSQFHTTMGKGKNKATAARDLMQGLWKRRVHSFMTKLVLDNAVNLLSTPQLLIDCTDNIEARRLISTWSGSNPVLHGCLSADGTMVRVVWDEHGFQPDAETPGQATCEDGVNLPFHAMAGGLIANVAQLFLTSGQKESYQMTSASIVRIR